MDKNKLLTKILAGVLLALMVVPTIATLIFYLIAL